MPASHEILGGLTTIANQWRAAAVAWHVVVGTLLVALVGGWRPSRRLLGIGIALSLASVSALSWGAGNPFNGAVFGVISLALALIALRLQEAPVQIGSTPAVALGATLVAFGWIYPHFLAAKSWSAYLYAAPLGLIPCPTLAAAIGLTFIASMLDSRRWSTVLATTGILYGVVGVARLGVVIDVVLLVGAIGLFFAGRERALASQGARARLRMSADSHV